MPSYALSSSGKIHIKHQYEKEKIDLGASDHDGVSGRRGPHISETTFQAFSCSTELQHRLARRACSAGGNTFLMREVRENNQAGLS